MSLSINDSSGLYANNQLQKSQSKLFLSLAKLAAGQRITKASDDASGLAIADNLNSQARGFGQAIRNTGDALSILQVADGALSQSADLISSIRVKAMQANNASLSPANRQAIQTDINNVHSPTGQYQPDHVVQWPKTFIWQFQQ